MVLEVPSRMPARRLEGLGSVARFHPTITPDRSPVRAAVPVNPALRRAQVAHILADSGAALLVTQAARAATLEAGDRPDDCRLVEADVVPMADAGPARSDHDPASLAAIVCRG